MPPAPVAIEIALAIRSDQNRTVLANINGPGLGTLQFRYPSCVTCALIVKDKTAVARDPEAMEACRQKALVHGLISRQTVKPPEAARIHSIKRPFSQAIQFPRAVFLIVDDIGIEGRQDLYRSELWGQPARLVVYRTP